MATIKALRGIRYDWHTLGEQMSEVVAPPYDVIDADEQDELYARHPHNIIRVDLNRQTPDDHDEDNRYTRSRRHLMDWLARGVLTVEDAPSYYVHIQSFDDGKGGRITRRGFIGGVELAEYDEGVVLPHERTLRGPKVDRLELMKATECNLSQIFMLYDDPDSTVDEAFAQVIDGRAPDVDITTPDGITHQLWAVHDAETTRTVEAFFEGKSLLIADGHHRYETALAYRDFRRSVEEDAPQQGAPYEYVATFMVNMRDPGLVVFPTHRVVHDVADFDVAQLFAALKEHDDFVVERIEDVAPTDGAALIERCEAAGEEHPSFILLADGEQTPRLVQFVGDATSEVFDEETPEQVRALDVAILHEGIFDRMLGISKQAQEDKTNLRYKKKLDDAIAEVEDDSAQLVVLMNATPVEQVHEVCLSGGKMPQKSTYFYPKILSGLVISPL